jgi:hypothetical protein
VEEYLHSPKAKEVWKIIVKKHQNKFWKETCKEDKKILATTGKHNEASQYMAQCQE